MKNKDNGMIEQEIQELLVRRGQSLSDEITSSEAFNNFIEDLGLMNQIAASAREKSNNSDLEGATLDLANMKLVKDKVYICISQFPGNNGDFIGAMDQGYFPVLREYIMQKYDGAERMVLLNLRVNQE